LTAEWRVALAGLRQGNRPEASAIPIAWKAARDHAGGQPGVHLGYGTFTIKGNRIEWLFINGGGIAPDNANNKPGEFFTFGWSLYRGVLTLSPVPGAVSPSNFRVKPWAQISTAPTARFLTKRCLPPAGALPP
jgi:hypothetical protein